jgi:hypothetical protein
MVHKIIICSKIEDAFNKNRFKMEDGTFAFVSKQRIPHKKFLQLLVFADV